MAKATNSAQYALQWKNHVSEILYGPVLDVPFKSKLHQQMRDTITVLCGQIDAAAKELVTDGVFTE